MPKSRTFDYVKYDAERVAKSERFKELVEVLEEKIHTLGAGRYQSLACTHLEITFMMIGKALREEQLRVDSTTAHSPERGE